MNTNKFPLPLRELAEVEASTDTLLRSRKQSPVQINIVSYYSFMAFFLIAVECHRFYFTLWMHKQTEYEVHSEVALPW